METDVVEVGCSGTTHRVRVEPGQLVPLDHDMDDERALAALGGPVAECISVATALAHMDDAALLTIAWDSSPHLARHLPVQEVVLPLLTDLATQARQPGVIAETTTAASLAARLVVARPVTVQRDAEIVDLTAGWWYTRHLFARQALAAMVGPRFAYALHRSLENVHIAGVEQHTLNIGLTDTRDSLLIARLRSATLEIGAYVAYSWLAEVWAAGIDADPGRLPVTGDGGVIVWDDVKVGRRSRRLRPA